MEVGRKWMPLDEVNIVDQSLFIALSQLKQPVDRPFFKFSSILRRIVELHGLQVRWVYGYADRQQQHLKLNTFYCPNTVPAGKATRNLAYTYRLSIFIAEQMGYVVKSSHKPRPEPWNLCFVENTFEQRWEINNIHALELIPAQIEA